MTAPNYREANCCANCKNGLTWNDDYYVTCMKHSADWPGSKFGKRDDMSPNHVCDDYKGE